MGDSALRFSAGTGPDAAAGHGTGGRIIIVAGQLLEPVEDRTKVVRALISQKATFEVDPADRITGTGLLVGSPTVPFS